jgi:hypothetical protein
VSTLLLAASIGLCCFSLWYIQRATAKANAEYLAAQARISELHSIINGTLAKINSEMERIGMRKGSHVERAHIECLLKNALKAEHDLGWGNGVQYQAKVSNRKGGSSR